MLFVPDRPFGFVHHFITADDVVFTQAQEIAEKLPDPSINFDFRYR
jgi:hypothetical protein